MISQPFTVTVPDENDRDHELEVAGTYTRPRPPAETFDPSNPRYSDDGDGGDLEIDTISDVRGGVSTSIPEKIVDNLATDPTFQEKVWDQILGR